MPKETITAEIGQYSFSVTTDDRVLSAHLRQEFNSFLSEKKPYFVIAIIKPHVSAGAIVVESGTEVTVVADNGSVRFYTQAEPELLLGTVETGARRGVFIHRHLETSLEYVMAFVRCVFQLFLSADGGALLHAAGIIKQGRGYLFPGPSGCGKTTITGLLPSATVLSDEFICLRKDNGRFLMFSTPWKNTGQGCGVLSKIFFPKKAQGLRIQKVSRAHAIQEIMPNVLSSFSNEKIYEGILAFLSALTKETPCYELHFSLDSALWQEVEGDS